MPSRVQFREDRCKGCLLCVQACPSGIIQQSSRFNQQGYKVAEVPAERMAECKGCAFCAIMCPDFAIHVFKTKEAA
ncbi:MAG: 4Fe-4S ferredoxin iron-sulfur binding domain protein [Desulfomicrobiaceae bacterium]|jgi:2-oxoglutarate ferredoxin oxidoreductase subunit delta|nr:4Fe-4S binding protein [Desulfomicrobiaceae bacterium]MBZ4648333.1 4Fe-4S ferredoxin iron-sulfur binding domain protein [Desulfomicrobiaceae bacterium]MBZ4686094.1 4Fe-4S ferredoxin iron-sulfur binding domain protein [Desulfomicrobiaceae bacterium]MDI3493120.1 2-oxoglutarate ferredoxin oxidoreductase subunit delta [Desulfomicrobiaceae bacterium]MDK2873803.1 2-oxoglutarate ferredoxin oxidoreductase subunit delta [Desulfomicrobiaceae bacterium]